MSRITKEQSELIAKKQLAPKFKAIADRRLELKGKVLKIRTDKLPEDLRAVYLKYKDAPDNFFNNESVYLKNESGHTVWVDACCIGRSNVVSNELFESENRIQSDEKRIRELRDTLAYTIYNLRTSKKVAEHFPELVQFLPEEGVKNELVNFNQLRDLIK